jgi:hypothetical protein
MNSTKHRFRSRRLARGTYRNCAPGRVGRQYGARTLRLVHSLPIHRRIRLQPLDRVQDPVPRLRAGHIVSV